MLARRIIPCLDVLDGRVVKGRQFKNLTDVGDPVAMASRYSDEGADEIVLLDISATTRGRRPFTDVVARVAKVVSIPLTVGGGIRTLDDIVLLLRSGADKVSLNTVLLENPALLTRAAQVVGSQALVGAIDARRSNGSWIVHVKSGIQGTDEEAIAWATTLVRSGAGELMVTSIDMDGMKVGYDIELFARLSKAVRVPIVASGGAGTKEHMRDVLRFGKADAVLAASLFHFKELSLGELKSYLRSEGIEVRI